MVVLEIKRKNNKLLPNQKEHQHTNQKKQHDSILTNIKLDETENHLDDENQFPVGQK